MKLLAIILCALTLHGQCPTLPALATLPSNGLAQKPPMGWNSWYTYGGIPSTVKLELQADAMVSTGMAAAGYQYIALDDGWAHQRDGSGNIQANGPTFPDMAALVTYIHGKGLKAGVYSSPGTTTCAGLPASMNHELQDATQYAAWGFDLLKYDFCGASTAYTANSCTSTVPQIWQLMAQSLRATGRDMVYMISDYGVSASIAKAAGANIVRTGQDSTASTFATWTSQVFHNNGAAGAGPGFWMDPDMIPIGSGAMLGSGLFTTDESKLAMSLFAIRAAPLFAGNDLTAMTTAQHDILTNTDVIGVDQDALGIQGTSRSVVGSGEVWAKQLSDGWAVGLFNLSTSPLSVASTWSMFGQAGSFRVRDLWAHSDLGVIPTGYTAVVPAHGVAMIKLTAALPPSTQVSGATIRGATVR